MSSLIVETFKTKMWITVVDLFLLTSSMVDSRQIECNNLDDCLKNISLKSDQQKNMANNDGLYLIGNNRHRNEQELLDLDDIITLFKAYRNSLTKDKKSEGNRRFQTQGW
ncbi:hypothetical protein NH340_JMT06408 [Sarcoptes scabiei]|nr:hypothetical protein NH340_JMT06408 [Sarcoptes scabiei]